MHWIMNRFSIWKLEIGAALDAAEVPMLFIGVG
jgi:hypothetical protein